MNSQTATTGEINVLEKEIFEKQAKLAELRTSQPPETVDDFVFQGEGDADGPNGWLPKFGYDAD